MASKLTAPSPPLDRRLVFVTGKGGVGKSTVAAALALIAAQRGLRTIVAELARRDDVWQALHPDATASAAGERAVFAETELTPGLFSISIDPELAMEEYLIDQLPRTLAARLGSSRTFGYLAAATPGLRELLAIGKVWELAQPTRRTPGAQPYDLVVVDAPATGHGVACLTAPRTFAAAAQVGPIARQARKIHATLSDPGQTAVVVAARPTEASVLETLALRDALESELAMTPDLLVVNGVEPRRFGGQDARLLADARAWIAGSGDPVVHAAVRAAAHAQARARAQQAQIARLRRAWDGPTATLPHLFTPSLGPAELQTLARLLERRLSAPRRRSPTAGSAR